MFIVSTIEETYIFITNHIWRNIAWKKLTPEEETFISHYISENTKTRYMPANNGTYRDSGIINPLIRKGILYIASNMSEFRGEWLDASQYFPINMTDKAFSYFNVKLK
jgi:hypothetical protein